VSSTLTVKLRGGLGNQLFKVLAGIAFARKLESKLIVDTTWYKPQFFAGGLVSHRSYGLDYFPYLEKEFSFQSLGRYYSIDRRIGQLARKIDNRISSRFGYITDENYSKLKEGLKSYTLDGNFENLRLLPKDEDLKKLLAFPSTISPWYEEYQSKLGHSNYISVHVRRGDYLNLPDIYDVLTPNYYYQAVELVREKIGQLPIVLFSDDTVGAVDWLSKKVKIDEVVRNDDDVSAGEVLRLQSLGRGIVAAHSTFSWWSAKIGTLLGSTECVVLPNRYFRDPLVQTNDLLVKNWLQVEV
jgi:Glycosyl transferase family 11